MKDPAQAPIEPRLTILPSLRVGRLPNGQISMTRKFVAGMESYVQRWGGPVTAVMESGPVGDNLDNEAYDPGALPFRLAVDADLRTELTQSHVVLASASFDQVQVARMCRDLNVPCAYVTEYSLRTRLQIVGTNTRNPILRLRRALWEWQTERRVRSAIEISSGVQCNGTPTFEAYKDLTGNPLLFFDTRSSADSLIAAEALARRLERLRLGHPLRLVFSGRLIRMKGADHLLAVAHHLARLNFPFEMTICGDGELAAGMRSQIGTLPITMAGNLDFESELQPLLKESADLFVCCHRQGDPSCTYLETMAAGLPIVGYDNEAFVGVSAAAGAGWPVPMNRPDLLATKIAELSREAIAKASQESLAFASLHTFESTFDARIAHLKSLARSVDSDPATVPAPPRRPDRGLGVRQ